MIPIRLNLLSPAKRQYLEQLVYAQFLRNIIEMAVMLIAIAAVVFLAGELVLQEHLNALSGNLTTVSTRQAAKNSQLRDINAILDRTDSLQKNYLLWSETVEQVVNTIPSGVVLSELTLDTPGKKFIFIGVADTRETLLQLQDNLQALPHVATAQVPISQLTDKENIPFSITASLK